MSRYDIVYVLKNNYSSEELRFSIRSVVQNFPYRKIVFVGGTPEKLKPDIEIYHNQVGLTKWERAMSSLRKALENENLTENIWLFNDDFFIMDKVKEPINYTNGTLEKRVIDLKKRNPRGSEYINELDRLRVTLLNQGKDALSFALHIPFLVNRYQALQLFNNKGADLKMFRSYYGNYYQIPCQFMNDVKVFDLEHIPATAFISTTDESFKTGKVGEFLRTYFDKPTKYELDRYNLSALVRERYTEEGDEISE